ncbi:MAG: tyrosine-type recombinase/integrase, partial [Gemmatimonadota bacterium]|nr:tyrosine-type recombinase/integrase [Gemmatimonadota bacterium]
WRAKHEKTGYEHTTPVTGEAIAALEQARRMNPGDGDAPVLPSSHDPSVCATRWMSRTWWDKAERLAGLEKKRGSGWHSLRRKFASDLMDQPLKVLCELGGWKDAKTVLQCYQKADEDQLRQALANRRRLRA